MDCTSKSLADQAATIEGEVPLSYIDHLLNCYENILQQHRAENPDLYRLVELRKKEAAIKPAGASPEAVSNTTEEEKLLWGKELRGSALRAKIQTNQRKIRQSLLAVNTDVEPRTEAHNRKCNYQTIKEEREYREDALEGQIKAWRSLLPSLIRKFARIPDYTHLCRFEGQKA